MLGPACGGDEAFVDLVIDAGACTETLVSRVVVRVFSAEGDLVETFARSADDGPVFPTGVRVAPRDGDTSRAWAIEADALDSEGVSVSFQRAFGAYAAGAPRELALPFDDACLGLACRADETCRQGACVSDFEPVAMGEPTRAECPHFLWVDGTAGVDGDSCEDPAMPCATIQHAVDEVQSSARGYVLNVHGESTYQFDGGREVVELNESAARANDDHRIVRAWPGTGRPIVDASGADKGLLINDSRVVIDGFEIHSAMEHGIAFNSSFGGAQDGVVRNCEIWGNGTGPMPSFPNEAGISLNNDAARITIVDNVLRDNLSVDPSRGAGVYVNSNDDLIIVGNVIRDNQGEGLRLNNVDRSIVRDNVLIGNRVGIRSDGNDTTIEDNAICGSTEAALFVNDGASTFRHNTVVDSGDPAIQITSAAWTLERNIIAFGAGFGLGGTGSPVNRENLYFMNASGETEGITRSAPDTDLLDTDPLLTDRAACDVRLGEGSPARGAAGDGSDIGVRF